MTPNTPTPVNAPPASRFQAERPYRHLPEQPRWAASLMSRSVHTSRAKFRKAFRSDYSSDQERTRVLGKIIDEVGLKRTMKANARLKKQSQKVGVKPKRAFSEHRAGAADG